MNPNISIIIIKSQDNQYQEAVKWIFSQTCADDIEIICIENSDNSSFQSAASALNHGARLAQGSVLIFMHQDVYLWDSRIVEKYYDFLTKHKNVILGVAGASAEGIVSSDIYETLSKIQRNPPTCGKMIPVVSVDECLFAMHRDLWKTLKFDEICCDNWHCYAMDICFSNTLHGGKNYVLSGPICHDSLGNPEQKAFWHTVKKLVSKYRQTSIRRITGCCVDIECTWLAYTKYYLTHRIGYPILYRINKLRNSGK